MKAPKLAALLARLRQHYAVVAHGDGVVHLPPMLEAQWRQDRTELREASEVLFDPAALLEDGEVLEAALARPAVVAGLLRQLRVEVLREALEGREP